MPRRAWSRFTILTIGILSLGFVLGARTAAHFQPPRTGVVDVAKVFKGYRRSVELGENLKRDERAIRDRLAELESRAEDMRRDLQLIKSPDKQYEKIVERFKLELKARQIRELEFPRIAQKKLELVGELNQEIESQIKSFALANNLHLILEKSVQIELQGKSPPLNWPIVHFVVPELDITDAVTLRLNDMYRK